MILRMKPTGLLSVWNRIAPEHEAEFNAWYDAEHLDERVAVPGFHSARRYRAVAEPHAYAALYELDAPDVLQTPAYLQLLANPTPRTRAIMPYFLDMNRAACLVTLDSAPEMGSGRFIALLTLPQAPASLELPFEGVRVRVAVPDAAATGGPTPEQKLRGSADRIPSPFILVEGDSQASVSACSAILSAQHASEAPRIFRLVCARGRGAAAPGADRSAS